MSIRFILGPNGQIYIFLFVEKEDFAGKHLWLLLVLGYYKFISSSIGKYFHNLILAVHIDVKYK